METVFAGSDLWITGRAAGGDFAPAAVESLELITKGDLAGRGKAQRGELKLEVFLAGGHANDVLKRHRFVFDEDGFENHRRGRGVELHARRVAEHQTLGRAEPDGALKRRRAAGLDVGEALEGRQAVFLPKGGYVEKRSPPVRKSIELVFAIAIDAAAGAHPKVAVGVAAQLDHGFLDQAVGAGKGDDLPPLEPA